MSRLVKSASALVLWSLNGIAFAQRQVSISTNVHSDVGTIVQGIITVLLGWSGVVATALFLLGCLLMVGSAGSEKFSSSGKTIMKASLIGLAIILASWLILSTVVYLISA